VESVISESVYPFLQGGGEMGVLTRNYDWSKTALGSPDKWPQNLRAAVSILLNSQFPMFVWWGSELTTIYNDSYKIIAGDKHPALLGKSGREGWSEIWNDLAPLVENVFNGNATWSDDLLLLIRRHGFVEETYFTFSYSPIFNESGSVDGLYCACIETTEKVISKRKLEESETRFRNMVIQAPVAITLTQGADVVIESINKPMLQVMGKENESDVLGKKMIEVLPEIEDQPVLQIVKNVLKTGEIFKGIEMPVKLLVNGKMEQHYFDLSYTPLKVNDEVTGVLHVAINVTEQVMARKRIEESEAELQNKVNERTHELAEANRELKRSNAYLEEFAHAASHDLKEPIRKIHFFTDRLKNQLAGRLQPEDNKIFERVEYATKRMNSLIDDLLLYSHVSQKPREKEAVDLKKKLNGMLEDLELDIMEKGAVVNIGDLPTVLAYPRQLQQLFHNLLTNALKYTHPDRRPEIDFEACIVSGENVELIPGRNYYLITVRDNGIGFEQEEAERIFQMFQRLHGRNEYEGTGVGLSITRKVAENHDGRITAQGDPGKGATFNLYLPVE
jgi:PAS domain S-box-containing protein